MSSLRLAVELAVIALISYGAYFRWSPVDDTLVELTPAVIDGIAKSQEELLGRALTNEERADVERAFIEEEILVREAFRRGIDRGDSRVRSMLIEHAFSEILRASDYEPPTPSETELRAFFDEHAERYLVPERVDLDQVSFPLGTAPAVPDEALVELQGGADPKTIGSARSSSAEVREVALSRIAGAFGLELAIEIFSLPEGEWHGPFASAAGTHLFRVTKRWPSRAPSYEEVSGYIEDDFLRDAAGRVVDGELERIRTRYRVELDDAR